MQQLTVTQNILGAMFMIAVLVAIIIYAYKNTK